MIASIHGKLNSLEGTSAFIMAGPFELEVFVPDFVRRQLQSRIGEVIHLQTMTYLEGNPAKGGRLTPRMVGFTSNAERTFFELICSVDGLGMKKALKAIVRPVREVAAAIEQQDTKTLSTLPGIGPAVAERIVAKLRRKMTRFALMVDQASGGVAEPMNDIVADTYEALIALGHSVEDARSKLDVALEGGKKYKKTEDLLAVIYQQEYS